MSFEITMENGEFARNEQFLLSHSVFYPFEELSAIFVEFEIVVPLQTLSFWKSQKIVVRERVNPLPDDNILDWSKLKQNADNILKSI